MKIQTTNSKNMRLHNFKTSTEIIRRKTRLARIIEKTSGIVSEILLATNETKAANEADMARQMANENAFETYKSW